MTKDKEKRTSIINIRINKVVDIILEDPKYYQSKKNKELTEKVKKEFNVRTRQALRYIGGAREAILEMIEQRKAESLQNAIIDREFLLKKAKDLGDYKLALDVAKDRDKILGLYEENIKHSGEVSVTFVEKLDE